MHDADTLWYSLTNGRQLFLIAGPCVMESEALCFEIAEAVHKMCQWLKVPFIFKVSRHPPDDGITRVAGNLRMNLEFAWVG